MIRSTDAASAAFLDRLRTLNERLHRVERQVAGGKRLEAPSDDPDSVAGLLSAKSGLARLDQTLANLDRFKTEANTAEAALQQAVKMFDRVRTLGSAGASGTQSAETRKGIAEEVGSILERMAGLANTEVDGRYIFSGDGDQTAPFELDLLQSPPWSVYRGLPASREAMHPTGVTFRVSLDAETIFNNAEPGRNAFQAMENLRQALLASDEAAIQTAIEPLAQVSAALNSSLTFYGNVQSQLSEASDTGSKMRLQLKEQVSTLEDADVTEAIVELQQVRFTQQAALEVKAKIPKSSLFDYLA
jgi:flagellar hook-associated protein 3 FlgL